MNSTALGNTEAVKLQFVSTIHTINKIIDFGQDVDAIVLDFSKSLRQSEPRKANPQTL